MASNKRVRGIAIHRPILIGSTATPLTPSEKLSADPHHTHRWTVAVRSAASNPLPTHSLDERGLPKPRTDTSSSSSSSSSALNPANTGAAAGTRGRDTETDYHRHVGGKDDISHFIRRVQFKLHESFPSPVRTIDRPPFQVSETGWGEFEIMVKIWWVAEAAEKFLQVPHYLKLHPWPNMPLPGVPEQGEADKKQLQDGQGGQGGTGDVATTDDDEEGQQQTQSTDDADQPITIEEKPTTEEASTTTDPANPTSTGIATTTQPESTTANALPPPPPPMAPVVHSWQYDEIVFPEPTEAFYQTLLSHPPTPLPATPHQAFTDPKTSSRLQQGFATNTTSAQIPPPPYPLYAPSSAPYLQGISQASIQAEADRLDIARVEAVKELTRERDRLIEAEKELRSVRKRADEVVKG